MKFRSKIPLATYHTALMRFQTRYPELRAAIRYPPPIPAECPTPAPADELRTKLDFYRQVQQWHAFELLYTRLLRNHGGGLLDAYMGFGKTLVALMVVVQTYIDARKEGGAVRPILLVASPAVQSVWQALSGTGHLQKHLAEAWHVPVLNVRGLSKSARKPAVEARLESGEPGIIMTGYEFARDNPWLLQQRYALVIADEIQRIKNATSATSQAFYQRRPVPLLGLSGTWNTNQPLSNTFSVLKHIAPDLVSQHQNDKGFISPENLRKMEHELVVEFKQPSEGKRTRCYSTHWCEMTPSEQATYDELDAKKESTYSAMNSDPQNKEKTAAYVTALNMLRRFGSAAENKLKDYCDDVMVTRANSDVAEPRQVTICDNLDVIRQARQMLLDRGVASVKYTGEMTRSARESTLSQWYAGEGPGMMFININVGAEGIDLTAANVMFHLTTLSEYNPGKIDQQEARIDRSGQRASCVYYHYYGTRYTLDRAMVFVRQAKRKAKRAIRKGKSSEVDTGVMRALRLVHKARDELANSGGATHLNLHPNDFDTLRRQTLEDLFPDAMRVSVASQRKRKGPELSLEAFSRQQQHERQSRFVAKRQRLQDSYTRREGGTRSMQQHAVPAVTAAAPAARTTGPPPAGARTTADLPSCPKKKKARTKQRSHGPPVQPPRQPPHASAGGA
jgi:superfamily II DNA or RNA helicase